MNLPLDQHELEERQRWQRKLYDEAIERVLYVLRDTVRTVEQERANPPEAEDARGMKGASTADAKAGRIVDAMTYAATNAGLSTLIGRASDLQQTLQALAALAELRTTMPAVAQALDAVSASKARAKAEAEAAAQAARDFRERTRCEAATMHGPGYHPARCEKRAVDERKSDMGVTLRVCSVHKKSRAVYAYKKREA